MKNVFYILVIVVLSSCSVIKKSRVEGKVDNLDFSNVDVQLNDEQERKFNYYFYEGIRYKAINEPNKSFMYFAEALKIDSTCSSCAYELSRLLLGNENIEEAEKLMNRAVKYSPGNRYYVTLLSRIYQNNDKGEEAVKIAERLIELNDPEVDDYYFVAQVQVQNGLYEKAMVNLNIIENLVGINEGLSFEKYQIYLKNDEIKKAENELLKLIEKFPGNSDYHIYLGDFYLEQGDNRKAKEQYTKALDKDKDNGKVHFSMANYYMQMGDTARFKSELFEGFGSKNIEFDSKFRRFMPFVAQRKKENNPLKQKDIEKIFEILIDTHAYEAKTYGAYGNFLTSINKKEEAKDLFEEALNIDASQSEIWQEYLFLISSIQENDLLYEKSSEAVKFFPEIPLFRLFQGVSMFQMDKLEGAATTMEKGLENVEDNPGLKGRFHAYLGDIYHSLGNIEKCFSHYDKALEIDENDVIVLNNYSYYLALRGENLDKAENMSARTVELEPGNATYLDTYAWVLFKKGRYSEAKFIIERAVDNLEEPSGVVIEHYGDILFKNGDVEGAVEKWKKAIEIGDHSELIKEKIEKKEFIDGEE
ncbi:tetratricopeptide repeat protein [Marinilabilia rubra]|uniref:Uncharacterized protein n=1 Tax=Marinilabilia rubra TaxID=2162893 RepID=A0A2U2B9J2_9BACT|nr:tetratricopeptide repeat protein [Marinilabilia rubra]PWD99735.1 hypothetical protein DDZ16_09840 [Marinilabilia rubra]